MTDRENFLERWSRRKSDAARTTENAETSETPDAAPAPDTAADRPAAERATAPAPAGQIPPAPAFDPASLPSLDSITSATDVRAFLAPGVPLELTRAALRRAWVADPAIRDFKGLQEYDWDFTVPGGAPGFGDLPAGTDIKKLVAQVFGETGEDAAAEGSPKPSAAGNRDQDHPIATKSAALESQAGALADRAGEPPREPEALRASVSAPQDDLVHRNNITASHNSISDGQPEQPKVRRSQGRALPK